MAKRRLVEGAVAMCSLVQLHSHAGSRTEANSNGSFRLKRVKSVKPRISSFQETLVIHQPRRLSASCQDYIGVLIRAELLSILNIWVVLLFEKHKQV